MKPIAATFADCRPVKTRSVWQLIFEVPIEQADAALAALGGVPQPASERWVGIALLDQNPPLASKRLVNAGSAPQETLGEPGKSKRPFSALGPTAQSGMRCADAEFTKFLQERSGYARDVEPAAYVRELCGVTSRADLDKQLLAGNKWRALEAEYQAWRTTQRYAESVRR